MASLLSRTFARVSRRATAPLRALPDYLILGAQKAGTTSLQAYLVQHPEIRRPERKEVHYFDFRSDRPLAWYRSHFPLRAELRRGGLLTGEATPFYLFHPEAAGRIAARLPEASLIVLLRNPVDRAISHYFHARKIGVEKLEIAEALARETARLAAGDRFPLQHFSYRARGIYVDQLARYTSRFPSGQLLVIRAEDLFEDLKPVLERTYAFLGVDPGFRPSDQRAWHRGSFGHEDVPDAVVRDLEAFYRPHNERLYAHLGVDFGW